MTDLFNHTRAFFHFIGRLLYRLSRWGNRPLSEEQLRWIGKLRDAAGYKRGYKDALETPMAQVQQRHISILAPSTEPTIKSQPAVVHVPPGKSGILSRTVHNELEMSGKLPRISGVLRSINLTQHKPAGPRYTKPLDPRALADVPTGNITPPKMVAVQLQQAAFPTNDDWLNTQKGEPTSDPFLVPLAVEDDATAVTEQRPAIPKRLIVRFDPRA